jgi:hypothetical protein
MIGAAEKSPGWREFVTTIDKLGLSPIYRQARDIVESKLRPLGLPAPPTLFGGGNEIFVSPDCKEAIFVRRANEESRRGNKSGDPGLIYDVLLISGEDLSEFEVRFGACVRENFGASLYAHTSRELRLKDRLSKRLGDLSPNGNLLADKVVRNACRRLVDDELRDQVSSVVNTFGDRPAPKSALEKLEPFVTKPGELANLVGSPDLASPHYSIACSSCSVSQLLFSNRSHAESAMRDAGHRCGTCGEKQLSLLETFAITEPFVRALRQGL